MSNCLVCKQPLSINYSSTVVRKAIKPPKQPRRWIELGAVHEACEKLVLLENDPWKNKTLQNDQ